MRKHGRPTGITSEDHHGEGVMTASSGAGFSMLGRLLAAHERETPPTNNKWGMQRQRLPFPSAERDAEPCVCEWSYVCARVLTLDASGPFPRSFIACAELPSCIASLRNGMHR